MEPFCSELISGLVTDLGTAGFERRFYEDCRALLRNQQCNVFVLREGVAPACMLTFAEDREIRDLTRRCATRYLTLGVPSDPLLAEMRRARGAGRRTVVRSLSPSEIADHSYRRRFYDEAAVRQKLAVLSQQGDRLIYLNFYRDPDQADFTEPERARLCDMGQVLCALLARHHRMVSREEGPCAPRQTMPEAFRAQLFGQVRAALLAEPARLTGKEADVCAAIAMGQSAAGIALEYAISLNTVATHRKRAYAKLGISSQNELFARYYESLTNRVLNAVQA